MSTTDFDNLRERYLSFFGEEPATADAVQVIESALKVKLPEDLKEIAKFYSGGMLGGISHAGIDESGIIAETQRLRSAINLPHRFLFLAEPAESFIALDCEGGANGVPTVIWCDAHDVDHLDDLQTMSNPPETWPSYSAFFSYLLDEEEEERGEA